MKRLYFGGSFNPIHHGHLICARAVAEAGGYAKIVLVPSAQPPHKQIVTDMAPARDRLTMCRLAVRGNSFFEVHDVEIRRSGPSFTIDTVRQLANPAGQAIHWLIGADMLGMLPTWHEPLALLAEAHLVIMARGGWDFDWMALPRPYRTLRRRVIPAPLLEISATQIRRRVANGQSINFLTPPGVAKYIQKKGLYRTLNGKR